MSAVVHPAQTSPAIQRMLAVSRFVDFRPKQVILQQGAMSDSVYFILKGSVTVERLDDDGARLVIHYIRAGEFFGEMGMFDDELKRSATVIARTPCEAAMVSLATFRELIANDTELLMELTRQLAQRLRKTSEKLSSLAFLDVTGRVARTLLELAEEDTAMTHPDGMMIRITREELGNLVNCSREVAGNVLYALQDEGLIHLEGRNIVVHVADT